MRAACLALGLSACAIAGTPTGHSGSGGDGGQTTPDGGTTSHVCTMSCDDSNACTTDSCDADNTCVHATDACDDGDACTTDTCDMVTGCAHANLNHGTMAFTPTGTIQTFAVPTCVTSLHVRAAAGQGGSVTGQTFTGGLGATLEGDFPVAAAQVLSIVVGGVGIAGLGDANAGQRSGTGGGGSYVVQGTTILVIAGGGGGAGGSVSLSGGGGCNGGPGLVTQNGAAGSGMTPGAAGGTAGGGGTFYSNSGGYAGGTGGGGYSGNGIGSSDGLSSYGTPNGPGLAFTNGSTGGAAGDQGRPGAFGGGGAAGFTGGGGGGYSGGGAGGYGAGTYNGGGGGSINSGTNAINTPGNHAGAGTVVVTW